MSRRDQYEEALKKAFNSPDSIKVGDVIFLYCSLLDEIKDTDAIKEIIEKMGLKQYVAWHEAFIMTFIDVLLGFIRDRNKAVEEEIDMPKGNA